jgi:hypothetical protein
VTSPCEWLYSTFLKCVERGWYDLSWGQGDMQHIKKLDFE